MIASRNKWFLVVLRSTFACWIKIQKVNRSLDGYYIADQGVHARCKIGVHIVRSADLKAQMEIFSLGSLPENKAVYFN
jgi:hypothetical protein